MLSRNEELAWCAGVVDADGSISVLEAKGKARVWLRLVMTDRMTVRHFSRLIGAGTITVRPPKPPRKAAWTWNCSAQCIHGVLRALLPYLVTKHRDAELAIAAVEHPEATGLCARSRLLKCKPGNRKRPPRREG